MKSDAPADARSDAPTSLTLRYRYRFSTRRCANRCLRWAAPTAETATQTFTLRQATAPLHS
ncbi:hypothetical protein [Nostoc sp.]|uniref:hypothetical protein n=1 Tax=Nostoc sp. TaxID=1180 RepID=UPI002FF8A8B8